MAGSCAKVMSVVVLAALGMQAGACRSQSDRRREALPSLTEVKSGNDAERWQASGVMAAAIVTKIWLPADHQTINELWRTASTQSLSGAELRAWHENQMRAAVVSQEQLQQIITQLPGHFGVQRQFMTLTRDMTPLDPANPALAHRPVVVQVDGQAVPYAGGRMQLLLAADAQSDGRLKLTIVPHQYRPQVSLQPRSHVQAALDGKMFPQLMLRALLSPDEALLIAPDIPVPVVDDTRPEPKQEDAPLQPSSRRDGSVQEASVGDGSGQGATTSVTPPAAGQEGASERGAVAVVTTTEPVVQPKASIDLEEKSGRPSPVPFGFGSAVLTGGDRRTKLHQLLIIQATVFKLPDDGAGDDAAAKPGVVRGSSSSGKASSGRR